jgi:hypothetical protein
MPETVELEAGAVEAPQPQMTRAEAVELVLKNQLSEFDKRDYAERLTIARRRNKVHPSVELTLAELKELIPLKRDRWTYIKLAKNSHGLLSAPKVKGKRKPHMSKHQQEIKSTTLQIFKQLFAEKAERLQAVCKTEQIEYMGVPDSAVPELGARAAKLALAELRERKHRKHQKARRRQQFSRAVNAGIFGNAQPSERNYVNKGGQFGK